MSVSNLFKSKPNKRADGELDQYISQFNDFLNHVENKNFTIFNRRDDPLGDMLSWAKKIWRDKSKVENNMLMQGKQLRRAEEKIEEMSKVIETLRQERSELQKTQSRLEWEKDQIKGEHASELSVIAQQHSIDMQNEENKRRLQKEGFQDNIEHLKSEHTKQRERMRTEHGKEMEKLLGQLLVNQKDDQGWPDDKIGLKFRELQRLIESVTAPRNREFLIPSGQKLPSNLDPTNFLGRTGTGKSHFLLKSTLWSILREQFFSAPFGFGVLGPERSQKELFEMYIAWRKLFDTSAASASPDREDYAIFRQDSLANNWRSTTFQYIDAALKTLDQNQSPIGRLSTENFNNTVARIHSVLSEVAGLSHASVRPDIQAQIRQMVLLGRDIALQFGIQPAQLQLIVPKRDEKIKIGERFHDCEDGDSFKGKMYRVDLITAPGLQKTGDGRSDMSSQRAMVPCEIYPIEMDS